MAAEVAAEEPFPAAAADEEVEVEEVVDYAAVVPSLCVAGD